MPTNWNNFPAVVLLSTLIGCGGGGGSNSTPTSNTIDLSGTAIKGLIKGGSVKIYGFTGGQRQTVPLATGLTAQDGSYSLEITGYSGPVVVEISALSAGAEGYPSIMVCDIPAGCGTSIAFGDDYELSSGFSLDAVVPSITSGDEVTVNVTALTDLAAAYAESHEEGIDATTANNANLQVASLFSLAGDLLALDAVDITDADEMSAASEKEQRAALLSAGLLSAGIEAGGSMEGALDIITADFASNNGQLLNNESTDSATVTLEEIWLEAQEILNDDAFDNVDNLLGVDSLITNFATQASEATADQRTQIAPPGETLGNNLEIAAAFVQDLRDIGTAAAFGTYPYRIDPYRTFSLSATLTQPLYTGGRLLND